MIIVNKNFRQGFVKIKVSLLDDLWYLSHIILPGDLLTAKTERKIKLGDAQEGRTTVIKKVLTLQLTVIDASLEEGGVLRIKGTVAKGTDDVPLGAHHSFSIGLNDEFTLEKKSWPKFMQEKLDDAANNTAQQILIVLFDREEALLSQVSQQGITHIANIKGEVQNKQYATNAANSIVKEIVAEVQKQLQHKDFSTIVFASPGFWHAPLQKDLPEQLKKKAILLTAHAVEKGVVAKLLARPELQSALSNQRLRKEQEILDDVLAALAKDQVAYGIGDVKQASESGAIAKLVVTDNFMQQQKQKNLFEELDALMQATDSAQGDVHILYDDQMQKNIDGLGGIVAVLRWKL